MGNTPSHQQQNTNIYSSYIQQQQDLIYKQQQQINELYKFNLQSQQQMPSNVFFQISLSIRKLFPIHYKFLSKFTSYNSVQIFHFTVLKMQVKKTKKK